MLDPENASADLHSSGRSYLAGDYTEAAAVLRKAIDGGQGTVLMYSTLADCEVRAGDRAAAERSFLESLTIFPRSVFLRVRYAMFLRDVSRNDESEAQLAIADRVDPRQASGWLKLLTIGSVRTFLEAQKDPNIAAPADLLPADAVIQYLDRSTPPEGPE